MRQYDKMRYFKRDRTMKQNLFEDEIYFTLREKTNEKRENEKI